MPTRLSIPRAALAAAALAAGCASTPAPNAAARDCARLDQDIALTEQQRRDAQASEEKAWDLPIPLIGAGRYAFSKASLAKADRQLGELHAESLRLGCSASTTTSRNP